MVNPAQIDDYEIMPVYRDNPNLDTMVDLRPLAQTKLWIHWYDFTATRCPMTLLKIKNTLSTVNQHHAIIFFVVTDTGPLTDISHLLAQQSLRQWRLVAPQSPNKASVGLAVHLAQPITNINSFQQHIYSYYQLANTNSAAQYDENFMILFRNQPASPNLYIIGVFQDSSQ